jgi:peptide/nickel transport system permease protein
MKKIRLLLQRLYQVVPTLIGLSIVTFILLRATPGDPARLVLGPRATEASLVAFRARHALDQPLPEQYLTYLRNLVQGDWGQSIVFRMPALELIESRMEPTFYLLVAGLVVSLIPTLLLALLATARPNGWIDHTIRFFNIIGLGLPSFWLAIVLSLIFGVTLRWFPVSGFGDTLSERLHHIVLPSLTVAIAIIPILVRNLRATILEKQAADFVTAGHAKGLPKRYLFSRHILPNSILPSLNLLGVIVVYVLGISVIIEPIFAIPGLGQLFITSIVSRDYFVIQGLTLIFALITMGATLVVDIISMIIDPRIE